MPLVLIAIGLAIGLWLRRFQADRALADAGAWKARAAACERAARNETAPAVVVPDLAPAYGPGFVVMDDE